MAKKNNLTAAGIVQKWDGGERSLATELAKAADQKVRDEAAELRPELAARLSPLFRG